MRILIVGSGGREHAIGWAIVRTSPGATLVFAPGNPGTAALGETADVAATDLDGLVALARERAIDVTIVGPEAPLVAGIADRFEAEGLAIVGPSADASRLEGSKAWSKAFMARHGIPTAAYERFGAGDVEAATRYAASFGERAVVVKASGLAAGKGVVVCRDGAEGAAAVADVMGGRFGAAADEIVVEAFLDGEEASLFVLTDGEAYVLLPTAQDHKRLGDGDTGPNTGGMGAYAPAPAVTARVLGQALRTIVEPTLAAMAAEGHPFRGFLYVGLMLTPGGPRVVEFNARMGDPEAQAVFPLLTSNLADLFAATAARRLAGRRLEASAGSAATVVLAAAGYPDAPRTGAAITGVAAAEATGALVFHAGTARAAAPPGDDGALDVNGGRVLAVTGRGDTLAEAVAQAYAAAAHVSFDGRQMRRDIGHRALGGAVS